MDLSNATIVADFGSGIGTEGSVLQIDTDNKRLGIGTDNPQAILQVGIGVTVYGNSGIVSATYFYGDASNITNTGSSLDAASGSQRVVVTSQTSGTMTAAATNGDLVFNASTNTLSSENISIGGTLTYEDVTSVDSVGIITARTGLKVTSGGINAAGVVTATSFSGDGSNLSGVESGVENFVASGAIGNGETVVINTDGTVGIVTGTVTSSSSGTPVVVEARNSGYLGSTYDTDNDKVIITYTDQDSPYYARAVVGTVSGTSITFGTPVIFESARVEHTSVAYIGSSKVVIAYQDVANSNYGTAIVGTVSGTSISFGSAVVFNSSSSQEERVSSIGNDKVVIAYRDAGASSWGKAIVGTVSGTSISFGTAANYEEGNVQWQSSVAIGNDKVVFSYQDAGDTNKGKARVGTVSGTSISFGAIEEYESNSIDYGGCTYDSTNDKVIVAYSDNGNSASGTARVGTVSGTSISFGAATVYNSGAASIYNALAYDSAANRVVIAYRDQNNSGHGTLNVGTVSGTSISFGDKFVFESAEANYNTLVYDPDNEKIIISYQDNGNSNAPTSVVFTPGGTTTNLTATNYIGIAGEAIANTSTGKINVVGGVNSGQSGLTTAKTYYVGQTGILTTTADTPSVVAGTSISDTKVVVWRS